MASNSVFQMVGGARPGRSVFDLSYEYKTTVDMGDIIPCMVKECVPGDVWDIGIQVVARALPLVYPLMHNINIKCESFFCPTRLLMDSDKYSDSGDWEDFISGGEDGADTSTLPKWTVDGTSSDWSTGSLWDYIGFPIGVSGAGDTRPVDFPKRMYNLIWNEYYRHQFLQTEVDITTSEVILKRTWERDYFTAALPYLQLGTAPSFPISGTINPDFSAAIGGSGPQGALAIDSTADTIGTAGSTYNTDVQNALEKATVDLSGATTFDIADFRLAAATQMWLERNMRAGVRHSEFLRSHFGVFPRDERLERPEFIGSVRFPLQISEVLQTSSEAGTEAVGTMAGHGIAADGSYLGKYRVKEYGYIMTMVSIIPTAVYQQGIDRQFIKDDKLDFYFPEFAHLSEQPIYRAELYATSTSSENETVFGYIGRYDELRSSKDVVTGYMRSDAAGNYEDWHLARDFGAAPTLNSAFVQCDPDDRCFAVASEPHFMVTVGNLLRAVRPIPAIAVPGSLIRGA